MAVGFWEMEGPEFAWVLLERADKAQAMGWRLRQVDQAPGAAASGLHGSRISPRSRHWATSSRARTVVPGRLFLDRLWAVPCHLPLLLSCKGTVPTRPGGSKTPLLSDDPWAWGLFCPGRAACCPLPSSGLRAPPSHPALHRAAALGRGQTPAVSPPCSHLPSCCLSQGWPALPGGTSSLWARSWLALHPSTAPGRAQGQDLAPLSGKFSEPSPAQHRGFVQVCENRSRAKDPWAFGSGT